MKRFRYWVSAFGIGWGSVVLCNVHPANYLDVFVLVGILVAILISELINLTT